MAKRPTGTEELFSTGLPKQEAKQKIRNMGTSGQPSMEQRAAKGAKQAQAVQDTFRPPKKGKY